ncbi:MAG: polysaccharide biosynthesis tyrosine autokinase [Candidatus Omnitrophota bacterium]
MAVAGDIKNKLEQEIRVTLRDYWEIFYKHRLVFLITFAITLAIGTVEVFFVIPLRYKATAAVIVAPPSVQLISQRQMLLRENYVTADEVELMRSGELMQKLALFLKNDKEYDLNVSANDLKNIIDIYPRPRTGIVDIEAKSASSPIECFYIVKGLLQVYQKDGEERRENIIKRTYDDLSTQLGQKRKELEEAERKLTKFVIDHEIIARGIEAGEEAVNQKESGKTTQENESTINAKYLTLKSQRIDAENFLSDVKRYRKDSGDVAALVFIAKKEPSLVDLKLRDKLYEAERELSKLLLTQSELHPDVIKAKGQLDEENKKISMELDRAVQSLEISIVSVRAEENKLRNLIKDGLSETMVEYSAFRREVEVKKNIYDNFIQELQQLELISKLSRVPFLKILRAPTLPDGPTNPRSVSMIFSFFMSLLFSGGLVLLLEHVNVSLENVEEVEDLLGLSVLATVPFWKGHSREDDVVQPGGRHVLGLITLRHPKSIMSEAFRMLRTNIKFVSVDKQIKTILITSVLPKEGKSMVSANLAAIMARAGERVIIVDADLRKPMVHQYFDIDNAKGLSTLLASNDSLDDIALCDTEIENLKVLPSGPIPPNPNELLATYRLEAILSKLSEQADLVIVDSTPVLAVSDSLIVAAKTDATLLVLFASKTPKRAAQRTELLLKNSGAKILGSVFNGVQTIKGGYYYNYNY